MRVVFARIRYYIIKRKREKEESDVRDKAPLMCEKRPLCLREKRAETRDVFFSAKLHTTHTFCLHS